MRRVKNDLGFFLRRGLVTAKLASIALLPVAKAPVFAQNSFTVNQSPAGSSQALRFVPISECRVADTRNPIGPMGGPLLEANAVRTFQLSGNCQIPSLAAAYSINITVVPTGPLGYLTVWPSGQQQPSTSLINSDGRAKATAAIVPAGTNGAISIYVTDATHIIIDINGYFTPNENAGLEFFALTPCRAVDTRQSEGALGRPYMMGQTVRTFPILSGSCNIPATAQAYSLTITALPHQTLAFLTAWPTGQIMPGVSTLNAYTGTPTANAAILSAGLNGAISMFATDDVDILVDINGFFAAPGEAGLSLYAMQTCRLIDTRFPSGSNPFTGKIVVDSVNGTCGVPSSAQDLVLTATIVPPGPVGFLTLWAGGQSQPTVSTLNAYDGAITSNMAIAPVGSGTLDVFASDPAYVFLDVSSYFAP